MWSGLPLVISLILTPITSSYAQHTQETLVSFPFPECSRHMLLPWNLSHSSFPPKCVFVPCIHLPVLSPLSSFGHMFPSRPVCVILKPALSSNTHQILPTWLYFFSYILITFEHSIQFTYLFFFIIHVLYPFTKTQDSQEVLSLTVQL